jgi:hypothetical protein
VRAVVVSSVSRETPWAAITTPNRVEYCERHGYTFVSRHLPYDEAVADFAFIESLLSHADCVWCLDADALVTDLTQPLDALPLSRGMNVCEEGLGLPPPINCGSVIWTSSDASRHVLRLLRDAEPEWRRLTWIWQQWVGERLDWLRGLVTVHPPRVFNGCHHGEACQWAPGAFVYHPCGQGVAERMAALAARLADVRR